MFSSKIRLGLVREFPEFVKILGGELAFDQTIASGNADCDLSSAGNTIDVVSGCLVTGSFENCVFFLILGKGTEADKIHFVPIRENGQGAARANVEKSRFFARAVD